MSTEPYEQLTLFDLPSSDEDLDWEDEEDEVEDEPDGFVYRALTDCE